MIIMIMIIFAQIKKRNLTLLSPCYGRATIYRYSRFQSCQYGRSSVFTDVVHVVVFNDDVVFLYSAISRNNVSMDLAAPHKCIKSFAYPQMYSKKF